ncbi:MAG: gluconate permease [Planctomycetales bacterium]|nr:gluconate permease [Planctomycetales bacterium]
MHQRAKPLLHFVRISLSLASFAICLASFSATACAYQQPEPAGTQAETATPPLMEEQADGNTQDSSTQDDAVAEEPSQGERQVSTWKPLFAAGLGVFVVLSLMIGLKSHAFIALILGALTISCFVPLDVVGFVKSPEPRVVIDAGKASPVQVVNRVSSSLGSAVSGIGILVAMAAIIGKCMLVSGAADRIVQSALAVFGEKRAALAMMVSGFVLSIPVFFDTVFYLLVPLARSLYRRTGKNYLLYLAAIAAGGAITHTLVPPTPGPLLVAQTLNVDIGVVMILGLAIGAPTACAGMLVSVWLNKVMPIEMRPMAGGSSSSNEDQELTVLPSLPLALVPVLLPVLLISIDTVFKAFTGKDPSDPTIAAIQSWLGLFGSADLAMIIAALFAVFLCWKVQGHNLAALAEHVEDALLSGGVIILITAAGGAFGALLAMTEIQAVVKSFFEGSDSGGLIVILVAYGLAAVIKVAQGSSTVSMIISSSLVASITAPLVANNSLGFHPAYLVPVIGAGSLMGSWMNDSGFWVFAKMGVLTEGETLRSWTVVLSVLSITGLIISLVMVAILPFTS